jgi:hypothetical protein
MEAQPQQEYIEQIRVRELVIQSLDKAIANLQHERSMQWEHIQQIRDLAFRNGEPL